MQIRVDTEPHPTEHGPVLRMQVDDGPVRHLRAWRWKAPDLDVERITGEVETYRNVDVVRFEG
jgi:hypothetical protein